MLFNIIAPFYNRFMRMVNMDYSARIAGMLAPVTGMELLDLGGGTGINAIPLAEAGALVTIVDSSMAMLSRAKHNRERVRLIRADARKLPLPDNSFDIVLISDAWHHFRDQDIIIGEIARVLRPRGRLYIIDFDRVAAGTRAIMILEKMFGEPATFQTPQELESLLKSRGIYGEFKYIKPNQFLYKGIIQKPYRRKDLT